MNTWTLAPREATEAVACGTHVPIIKALAPVFNPRRILELGSGLFSTPLFLDRSVFPDLEFLLVIENDISWFDVVRERIGDNPHIDYRLIDGAVAPVAAILNIEAFDFIFIDDSRSGTERCATIRAVAPLMPSNTIAVIHDYEEQQYQEASLAFDHQFIFDKWNPACGVCWNGDVDHEPTLQALREAL